MLFNIEQFNIQKNVETLINMLHCSTWIFGETGWGAFRYLSFIAWRLATKPGKTEAKPGIWLRTQINSFSIQSRSWLLQTEMMNNVCQRTKKSAHAHTHTHTHTQRVNKKTKKLVHTNYNLLEFLILYNKYNSSSLSFMLLLYVGRCKIWVMVINLKKVCHVVQCYKS